MTRFSRAFIRVVLGAILILSLAAPGAGNVGGCGNSPPTADAGEHCINRRATACLRERIANRIDDAEYADCSNMIPQLCQGATWPDLPDGRPCEPTPDESNACIRILRREDLLVIPTPDLLMMTDLCNLCQ